MGYFDNPQNELADGRTVFYGELYEVGFRSDTARYWDGFGDLFAYSQTWLGRGQLVERSDIPFGTDDEAGELTLTLSGVDDDLLMKVRAEEPEFYGRPISIWGQFFDERLQPSGNRFYLYRGTMDVPTYGGTPGKRSVAVAVEGEWSDRNGSKFEFFSNNSQEKRFPGDKGLEYVYRYSRGVRRLWPKF